jgi:nucleoside-diphosphate-sugar epimerase
MIFLTGASGFLGRALVARLASSGLLRISLRKVTSDYPENVEIVQAELVHDQDWSSSLSGVSVIIHCAARVHVMNEDARDSLAAFRKVNVEETMRLAQQAVEAGVRRFIFMSSIKVNGEVTNLGSPFTADDIPDPKDPYGISKYEAEAELRELSIRTGMEIVIIRPPLVYGPGVKANFLSMMKWLQIGVPLPLGGITKNRRSFVYLDNLVDMIVLCISHPAAANRIFLVSDGEDLSTTALLQRMALALEQPTKLIPIPPALITILAKLICRADISSRLCDSLQVDIKKSRDLLGWSPLVSIDEGFRKTAAHFLKAQF